MKRLLVLVLALSTVLCVGGCKSGSCCMWGGASLPDLKGEWDVETYSHHHAKHGYLENSDPVAKWTIVEQKGKHFHGERTITRKKIDGEGTSIKEGFSGVISSDNRKLYIVDHEEDIVIGEMLSDTEMVLYILGKTHKDNEPRAGYVTLRKVK